jgi:PIN domain nuclease of toxin-antitoxin system
VVGVIRLDTHVVVWLYTGEVERLGEATRAAIDTEIPMISPMVQLELSYLHEVGRLTVGGADIVNDLVGRIGLRRSEADLAALTEAAAALTWTRDPFDRLIVADALVAGATLLTKDRRIRQHTSIAQW